VPSKNRCLVFFDNDHFTLDDATQVLRDRKLSVSPRGGALDVQWEHGPVLHVRLVRDRTVREEAARLGAQTKYAERLAKCGSCLEITFADLDEVLDEINTLIEVQSALETATGGIYYNCWNGRFSDD
jgi:hypothetical protein